MSETRTARNRYDLTGGGILNKLLLVSLPMIGTQIIQMTYNLTDMFWLGRVGSDAVASSGTVGMYLWLSMAFLVVGGKGSEIGVSQNLGKGDRGEAAAVARAALLLALTLGVIVCVIMTTLRGPLIGFFNLREANVAADAQDYLLIVGLGVPFSFLSAAVSGIFNGSGNSRTPFVINLISLGANIVLDPIFIFTLDMGVRGAAVATALAQTLAAILLVSALFLSRGRPFAKFRVFAKPSAEHIRQIFKWTLPITVESFIFTFMSMLLTRLITAYGAGALAAQRVGSQIESLSWLIGGGYSAALTAYTGQNFGARKWGRIRAGFKMSAWAMTVWGVIITCVMFFGADALFRVFLPNDPDVVAIGVRLLRILSITQLIACFEGISAGVFRGAGRTLPPSLVSIVSNTARLIAAWMMSSGPMGLDGIFWAFSIGAAARGLWLTLWYLAYARKLPKEDEGMAPGIAEPIR